MSLVIRYNNENVWLLQGYTSLRGASYRFIEGDK